MTELSIKVAASMYKCRDSAKRLYGIEFDAKISDYKRYIKAAMSKHNISNEIEAALKLAKDCQGIDGSGVATMNIFAACVELIEPSN